MAIIMTFIIRQYKEADLQAVLESWEIATRLVHKFMSDEFITQGLKDIEKIYLPITDTWVIYPFHLKMQDSAGTINAF